MLYLDAPGHWVELCYFDVGSALLPCTLLPDWGWHISLEGAREGNQAELVGWM